MSGDSINAQVVVRTLARKPGWKDSNIQVSFCTDKIKINDTKWILASL